MPKLASLVCRDTCHTESTCHLVLWTFQLPWDELGTLVDVDGRQQRDGSVTCEMYGHGNGARQDRVDHFTSTLTLTWMRVNPLTPCACTRCACRKRRLSRLGPPPEGGAVQTCPPPPQHTHTHTPPVRYRGCRN